jgi:hypothetical protein
MSRASTRAAAAALITVLTLAASGCGAAKERAAEGAAERLTDAEDVDIDRDGGTVTIETSEGDLTVDSDDGGATLTNEDGLEAEFSYEELPADFPDVPLPEDAEIAQATSIDTGDGKLFHQASASSAQSVADVVALLEAELPSRGWTLDASGESDALPGVFDLEFHDDELKGTAQVGGAGADEVQLSYTILPLDAEG